MLTGGMGWRRLVYRIFNHGVKGVILLFLVVVGVMLRTQRIFDQSNRGSSSERCLIVRELGSHEITVAQVRININFSRVSQFSFVLQFLAAPSPLSVEPFQTLRRL